MSVLDRLLQMLAWRRPSPHGRVAPPPPAPTITTTPAAERRSIDERLQGVRARMAVLLVEAGLDERRTRGHGGNTGA